MTTTAAIIRDENDQHRAQLLAPRAGRTVMTAGIAALDPATLLRVFRGVVQFDAFTPGNDPHGEHDLGIFEVDGERIMWKFDYYADDSMTYGAEEPANGCYRVLTIMFAREY